ncbi:YHYH protein [Jannaschia donghaensis]|uniref:YHYH domain-containing protein n=1 Tax=Jannaschia donghaensis TaxID=420998 RepID=A0A0M6YF00_9RHOB|nr:YHYH protein [Jannaschia donghaensis]CTQ48540.1 hypothetical protein JDO7802_00542 [Jannaschia donghaensis]
MERVGTSPHRRAAIPTFLFAVALGFFPVTGQAHQDEAHCTAVAASVAEAGFDDDVSVTCEDGQALIASDTYPDHPMMTGILGTNEQVPVPAEDYVSPIPLQPVLGSEPHTRDAALGVAVNGVPIYDYTAGGEMTLADLAEHQTAQDTVLTRQLDICGGHAGRGDDYHYHATPTCMIEQMPNAGPGAILGWAFDGYPIYGDANPDGTSIAAGDLDVCNGQPDAVFGYRYHTSEDAPYIVQCLMGEVTAMGDLPRVPPLAPSGSAGLEAGVPPRGGVEDLEFTQDASGLRSMTYTYGDAGYYIRYIPADTAGCYDFETRRITDGGETFAGELCR